VYRMIAFNLDNTLLTHSGRLQRSTKEALFYAKRKGIMLTIVTSQSFQATKKWAKMLDIETPLVSHQGAYVSLKNEEPLFLSSLPEESVSKILAYLEGNDAVVKLETDTESVMTRPINDENSKGKIVWQKNKRIYYLTHMVDSVHDYWVNKKMTVPKIEAIFPNKKSRDNVCVLLEEAFKEVHAIPTSETSIDIVKKGISKWTGIVNVAEYLGLDNEEIVMIGSGEDDLPLIEWSGLGVAMGGSHYSLLDHADWITRSATENGMGYVIKEIIRKQQPIDFISEIKSTTK
jgi:Cof subfamily protein (haloacid dehalogenase superfamily)